MSNASPSSKGLGRVLRVVLPAVASVGVAVLLLIIIIPGERDRSYRNGIEEHRRATDSFMRISPDSPLTDADKRFFSGLDYFDVDPRFRVEATLEPIDETPVFPLATTGDTTDLYERYAWASFELDGTTYRLLVLRSVDASPSNRLFLAFKDATNGEDTYSGGRYVDIFTDRSGTVTIDFNRAYNPYCVYDSSYVCPVPPPENVLPIRVEAGERVFVHRGS